MPVPLWNQCNLSPIVGFQVDLDADVDCAEDSEGRAKAETVVAHIARSV